jgi:penicillin-binding protein 1A
MGRGEGFRSETIEMKRDKSKDINDKFKQVKRDRYDKDTSTTEGVAVGEVPEPRVRKSASGKKKGKKRDSRPPLRLGWPIKAASFFLGLLMIPATAAFIVYNYYAQDLPSIENLKSYEPKTVTYIYSDDGTDIGEFFEEYRLVAPLESLPQHVVLAFVAAEDANFYHHPGIDFIGILRAFIKNLQAKRIVQGGSTITQQVTRSFLLTNEKSIERKIREALLAYRLEQNLTKDQILHLYLNQIYLGRGAWGIEAAARRYFGKHASELRLSEAALIAGLVSGPSRYSPHENPEAARSRQLYVIGRMMEAGFIPDSDGIAALQEELRFVPEDMNPYWTEAPYFTEHVRQIAIALVGEERFLNDGLRIYTTVDLAAQEMARKAVKDGLEALTRRQGYPGPRRKLNENEQAGFLAVQARKMALNPLMPGMEVEALVTQSASGRNRLTVAVGTDKGFLEYADFAWSLRGRAVSSLFEPGSVIMVQVKEKDQETGLWKFDLAPDPDVQGAFVCIENATGAVKAMIGGRDFNESQFNRAALAQRQPGSSFKPFIYSAALDNGFTQASVVVDYPVVYKMSDGTTWTPQNYGRGHSGPMTLYQALVRSVNVVAVRLAEMVGLETVVAYAHKMGIKSELNPYLSIALGACEVNLLEMVAAFTTFPNLGERVEPLFITRIEDRNGRVLTEFQPTKVQALSPDTAYLVLHMMRGVVLQGTGRAVSVLKHPVAGKTGTTNDLADAWFVGYTQDYAAGAWVGHDIRRSLGGGEQGGRTAAPIFRDFMLPFLENKPIHGFSVPPGILTARSRASNDESDVGFSYQLAFRKDQVGPGVRSEHLMPPPEEAGTATAAGPPQPRGTREERVQRHVEQYLSRVRPGGKAPAQPNPTN